MILRSLGKLSDQNPKLCSKFDLFDCLIPLIWLLSIHYFLLVAHAINLSAKNLDTASATEILNLSLGSYLSK